MPKRSFLSWTPIISGYTQNGFDGKYLETLKKMHLAGVEAYSTTFVNILHIHFEMGSFEQVMGIHKCIKNIRLLSSFVAIALVGIYAKCRSIEKPCELFDNISQRYII